MEEKTHGEYLPDSEVLTELQRRVREMERKKLKSEERMALESGILSELMRRRRRKELRTARKEGKVPPAWTPHTVLLPNTEAHRILSALDTEGPKTSGELYAGASWRGQHTSAQILRLLDLELIDRLGRHFSITDKGLIALARLNQKLSHTEWLKGG